MANNVSLLQHQIGKFGVVTVMDAVLFEYGTVKPVLKLDTLKVSSISGEGSNKEIRGGMAADLLMSYNYGRSVNIEITDALLSLYSLSTLWGSPVETLVDRVYKSVETATATGATDPFTSVFCKADGSASATLGTDYFVTDSKGKDMTSGTFVSGETYTGYGYVKGKAGAEAESYKNPVEIVLKSSNFPSALTLVGKTMFIDEQTGKKVVAEIEIPKFQLENTFNFSMDAEGDASTFNFNGKALADGAEKELIKIRTLKIENNASGAAANAEWK